jgi:rubrerythrin
VAEFGACYCALYVDEKVIKGTIALDPVPERRPLEKQARAFSFTSKQEKTIENRDNEGSRTKMEIKLKLWYCKQCGYVVFREDPPLICPICRAKKEMFTEIKTQVSYST